VTVVGGGGGWGGAPYGGAIAVCGGGSTVVGGADVGPHALSAAATVVAWNAKSAARPRREDASAGRDAGAEKGAAQNGHAVSLTRTCLEQAAHGTS
jgi:hypothetical protein